MRIKNVRGLLEIQDPKLTQTIAVCAPLHKVVSAASSQLRHVSTIGKNLLNSNMSCRMSPQYGEIRPSNGWYRFVSLGYPSKFQRASRLRFVTSATSGGQPHFARCLAVSCAGTLYIHFRGLFDQASQNFVRCKIRLMSKSCVLLYWQRYCTALQQPASAKLCK